jgi:hypothetical protein
MGTTVSNLKFWEEKPTFFGKEDDQKQDSVYLSYNVFLGLTILGGYLALDHLYLRSPLTFVAKIVVNILCFGVWYWYDVLQAVWNSDVVKLYGLSVPALGPKGIGAGVLAKDKPSKLHWNFLIYSICLMFGGIFGLDSFLVGDNRSGLIRLLSLISVFFAPIAVGWWAYNLFWFFTDTEYTIDSNHIFFGRELGGGSFITRLLSFLPSFLIPIIVPIVESVMGPITATMQTVDHSVQLATAAVDKIPEAVKVLQGMVDASSKVGTITPLSALATPEALQQASTMARAAQAGGNIAPVNAASISETLRTTQATGGSDTTESLNALPYTLIGTVIFISLAGFIVTYYRAKKHVTPEYDDSPPEPGVLRKPDQEKPTRAP